MEKRKDKQSGRSKQFGADVGVEVAERRSAIRKSFITEALIVEVNSGARITGRGCDLVVKGCYVDTLNPFKEGTVVRIRLQHGDSKVEAKGRVVYKVTGMGMGIVFNDLSQQNQQTLDEWLSNTRDEFEDYDAPLPPAKTEQNVIPVTEENQTSLLIEILQKKGILSGAEVALLLKRPVE